AMDEGLAQDAHETGEHDPVDLEFLQAPRERFVELGAPGERGMVDRRRMQPEPGRRRQSCRPGPVGYHRDDAGRPVLLAAAPREPHHVGATARYQHGDFFHRAILAPGVAPTPLRKPYNSMF